MNKIIVQGQIGSSDGGTSSIVKAESDNDDAKLPGDEAKDPKNEQEQVMEKLLSAFIGSLKVPCYNTVTSYYYYDILEALSRDMFQRKLIEKQAELLEEEREEQKEESGVKDTEGS